MEFEALLFTSAGLIHYLYMLNFIIHSIIRFKNIIYNYSKNTYEKKNVILARINIIPAKFINLWQIGVFRIVTLHINAKPPK
jgi:hypothetical protein